MLPLLLISFALGSVPGENDEEPVGFLLTADLGGLPRAVLELEAPASPWGSWFLSLGSPDPSSGLGGGRISGPQVAVGGRVFPFGRGPWGLFFDGRLLANLHFSTDPQAPSPGFRPGVGLTMGLNVKLWHVVVSPGLSLFLVPVDSFIDSPTPRPAVFPALRLAVGGWNVGFGSAPGERDEEPVGFLLTADIGSFPRMSLELEAPMTSWGSAFLSLGYPFPIGLTFNGPNPGPQVAAGWRMYLLERVPWGLFIDGRALVNVYLPEVPPSPLLIAGGGFTVGLNVKAWHVVVSPGISLSAMVDPTLRLTALPALRLAVGGWY